MQSQESILEDEHASDSYMVESTSLKSAVN